MKRNLYCERMVYSKCRTRDDEDDAGDYFYHLHKEEEMDEREEECQSKKPTNSKN